jgi:hypothetical protein
MTLIVNQPPPLTARLVFMATPESMVSRLVMWDTMGAVSHVAAMMDDGYFMSANIDQGVRRTQPIDELAGVTMSISVDIPMKQPQYDDWRDCLYSKNGTKFDTGGLIGIATDLVLDWHTKGRLYCAALQTDALRDCLFFPRPLAQKWHMITPVVLLLMLQAQPLSNGVIVHDPEYAK